DGAHREATRDVDRSPETREPVVDLRDLRFIREIGHEKELDARAVAQGEALRLGLEHVRDAAPRARIDELRGDRGAERAGAAGDDDGSTREIHGARSLPPTAEPSQGGSPSSSISAKAGARTVTSAGTVSMPTPYGG